MRRLGVLALLVVSALLVPTSANAAAATTYYVDPAGNDAAAGTSTDTAWRSLAKVNGTTFGPGDRILFKAGARWTGQLWPKGSGSATAPITIASYGGSGRPGIDGAGQVGDTVYLENQQYWDITRLEVTNDSPAQAERRGIRVRNNTGGRLTGIHISDVDVHNVKSELGRYYGLNAGIAVVADVPSSAWNDVRVTGNTVRTVERIGIFVGPTEQTGDLGNYPNFPKSNGVEIDHNVLSDIGMDAILTFVTQSPLIHHNKVSGHSQRRSVCGGDGRYCNGASVAIWMAESDGARVEYNEVSGGGVRGAEGRDGQAYDVDWGSDDVTLQYNYSHDNRAGFLLVTKGAVTGTSMPDGNNVVVRYNVSENDGYCFVCFGLDAFIAPKPLRFENNVDFVGSATERTQLVSDLKNPDGFIEGPFTMTNNIFVKLGAALKHPPTQGGVFRGNVYAGNHDRPPFDPDALTTPPLFVAPGTLDGYRVHTGSPVLGSGVPVPDQPPVDLYGNPIGTTPRGVDAGPGVGPSVAGNLVSKASLVPSSTLENYQWSSYAAQDGTHGSTPVTLGWTSNNTLATDHSESLEVRFPSRRYFDTINLFPRTDPGHEGQGFPKAYGVEVWDGSRWISVAERNDQPDPGTAVQQVTFPTQWTDRVRVVGRSLRPNPTENNVYRMQLAELEVRNQSGPQLTASSSYEAPGSGWDLLNLLDGAPTGWSSNNQLTVDHAESVELSYPTARTLSTITLTPRTDAPNTGYGYPTDLTLESWTGSAWQPLLTKTALPRPTTPQTYTFTPTTTTRLRLTGTHLRPNPNDHNTYRLQLAELTTN
ncbi:right-handed parallel beta-helix repeat-containing protein [Kribbella sp. NPDC051587]|uniref:right-handed parallel beta-helix repeat-containing protein n=1 Tax=Kribbella sp. NPDC051587 TaxID=3364119 RepID=UPI00378D906F